MIEITRNAADQLAKFLSQSPEHTAVRIGVRGGGCSGLEYSIGLIIEPDPDWFIYKFEDLKVFVDPISDMYLDGTIVDYIESLVESGFKFTNPNFRSQCGCGKSFSV